MTLVASFDRSISLSCTPINDQWSNSDWGFENCGETGETHAVVLDGRFEAGEPSGRDELVNRCDVDDKGAKKTRDAGLVFGDLGLNKESSLPAARGLSEVAGAATVSPTPTPLSYTGKANAEQQLSTSSTSFEDENTVGKPLDVRPKVFFKNARGESLTLTLDGAQRTEEKTAKRKRNKKDRKAFREKKQSKWRSVHPEDVGFHVSLLPLSLPRAHVDFLDYVEAGKEEGEVQVSEMLCEKRNPELGATCLELCASIQDKAEECTEDLHCSDTVSDVCFFGALGTDVRDASLGDKMDDVSFFGSLGIDVTEPGNCDDEEDDYLDWDGVTLSADWSPDYLKVKKDLTISAQCNEVSVSRALPGLATFERRLFFELECTTSKKIYIRKDKQRGTEKAHKAIKSKNCRTIANNKGRKTLFMHHRLIKMHGFDSYTDFRLSVRVSRCQPMPKRGVDLEVARRIQVKDKGQSSRAAPVQNLAHALHSSNAPRQLATDLASFLINLQHRELTPEDYDMLLRLDEAVAPKTISKSALASLRTEIVGAEGGGDALCSVCMEPYVAGQKQKFLRCGHVFHSDCIDTWLQNSSTNCPLDGLPVDVS